jgi:hypothetical protein
MKGTIVLNWLRNFMMGRYGADQLNLALIVTSLVLSVILMWIPVPFLPIISYIPLGWAIFRMFSRNILKRGDENIRFLNRWNAIKRWFQKQKQHQADRKIYRFLKCPHCSQKIRLPKGRGKLRVTCPKCRTEFIKKV